MDSCAKVGQVCGQHGQHIQFELKGVYVAVPQPGQVFHQQSLLEKSYWETGTG